jgi:hypothetical protein
MANCIPKGKESDDAETRKQAIKSLGQIVSKIGLKNLNNHVIKEVFETLFKALKDY